VGTEPRFASVRLNTGPRLHYAEQGDSDGVPVVLLHGWPDSWFSFSRVMPLLSSRLHAFVPDQRGFGDSDRPEEGYRIDGFAADVVAFLDALSIERAAIVGHSFGSFVARQTAATHPERVDRLVLIGTAVSASTPIMREVRAALQGLPDPVPTEFARDFQASTAHVPLPEPFFDRIVAESRKLPARLWRAALDALLAYDDAKQLNRIAAPTLLMWGDQDALFSRDDQRRLVAAIRGAVLSIYPETGHCPNWEIPQRVAADLQAFLSGASTKDSP
jgi:pimeloyl-ACP methyl ester carboxylesterase